MSEETKQTETKKKCSIGCKVAKFFLGLLFFIVVVIATIPLWVGPLAKTIANKIVPTKTGTDFNIQSISLNPFSGKLTVVECHLANPKGFEEKDAFALTKLYVDLDVCSLLTDKIHVREILVDGTYVSYVGKDGKNNFDIIIANATKDEDKDDQIKSVDKAVEEAKEETDEETEGKKVVIDKITISNTKVKMGFFPAIPLPSITLTDIGKENDGVKLTDAVAEIWEQIQKNLSSAGKNIGGAVTGLLSGTTESASAVSESAKKGLDDVTKGVDDAAKKTTEEVSKSVKEAGKAAEGLLKDAKKGLGDLFK